MSANWHSGNAAEDGQARRGWILGHFIDPAQGIRSSKDVEVKWGIHPTGEKRSEWTAGDQRTTLVILIEGDFRVDLTEATVNLAKQGNYVMWGPGIAKDLVALVIGITDIKPLLSWLTIHSQVELAECFGDLPFALVGKAKPSLEKYRSLVAGARNRAFRDLFAFGRPFRVPLRSDAFQAAALHLFREYKRSGPVLEFKDRQLVELLQGFTRAAALSARLV